RHRLGGRDVRAAIRHAMRLERPGRQQHRADLRRDELAKLHPVDPRHVALLRACGEGEEKEERGGESSVHGANRKAHRDSWTYVRYMRLTVAVAATLLLASCLSSST